MNIIQTVILGVVEGITEFLPISSTFHLIFTAKILRIAQNDFSKFFEVFIQSGAILSVTLLYFSDVVKSKELIKKLILSFLPTALIGFALYKFIKNTLFENQILMIGIFILVGLVFLFIEHQIRKNKIVLNKTIADLSYIEALLIGLFQAVAVVPGVSRAGAVIVAMMFLRFKRKDSAYYSFLISIPTIFAASLFDFYKMRNLVFIDPDNWLILITGFITALFSSFIVVKWFINFLKKNSLAVFGYYRLIVAIILILVSVVQWIE